MSGERGEGDITRFWRLKSARSTIYATKKEIEITKNNPGKHTETIIITQGQAFPPSDQTIYQYNDQGEFTLPKFGPEPGSTPK